MNALLCLMLSAVVKNNIRYCFNEIDSTYSVGCGVRQDAIADQSVDFSTIIIPESIYNKKITRINNYAFQNLKTIRTVQIYAKITSIGFSAFDQCSGLERVNIPASVTHIDVNAFCLSNLTDQIGNPKNVSFGVVHFFFEPGSKSLEIKDGGITNKETIIISYCRENDVIDCGNSLFLHSNYIIYSPKSISFCSHNSTEIKKQAICSPYPPTLPYTPCLTLDLKPGRLSYSIYFMITLSYSSNN